MAHFPPVPLCLLRFLSFVPVHSQLLRCQEPATPYIYAADCTVRCDCWLIFSIFSEKFNYRPLIVISLGYISLMYFIY